MNLEEMDEIGGFINPPKSRVRLPHKFWGVAIGGGFYEIRQSPRRPRKYESYAKFKNLELKQSVYLGGIRLVTLKKRQISDAMMSVGAKVTKDSLTTFEDDGSIVELRGRLLLEILRRGKYHGRSKAVAEVRKEVNLESKEAKVEKGGKEEKSEVGAGTEEPRGPAAVDQQAQQADGGGLGLINRVIRDVYMNQLREAMDARPAYYGIIRDLGE